MAGKDIIKMSVKELKRLKIIQEAIDRHITQKIAASIIGITERQTRRIIRVVRDEGEKGVIHKSRGMVSNRRIPDKIRNKVLMFYKKKYPDFGPTLASEKLSEIDNINISTESLRKWLIEAGIWKRRRKRTRHRQWRQRKECFGQMVQMDGSHHDWLEGRGPELVLMGYIDDATNNTFARFYDYEGTIPALDSFRHYIKKYGIPQSVYLDRHTIYKSNKKLSEEEEIEGLTRAKSQFERALSELGVEVIHAYSPQAKGRIERLFGVLQDRLIKEMRLRSIKTKQKANVFLQEYLLVYNKKFSIAAANETNVHVELPKYFNINNVLCVKTQRTIRNDNTISHNSKLYQMEESTKTKKVMVQERLDGSLYVTSNGTNLKYKQIIERPKRARTANKQLTKPKNLYIPPKYHPWRRWQYLGSIQKKTEVSVNNY